MRVAWGKIDSVLKEHKHGHFAVTQEITSLPEGGGGGGGGGLVFNK